MAQFNSTIGSSPIQPGLPAGWAVENGSSGFNVVANTETQYSSRALVFENVVSSTAITWGVPGVLGDSEVLTLMKFTGANAPGTVMFGPTIRHQPSIQSGYYFGPGPDGSGGGSVIRISRLVNGNGISLGTAPFVWTANTWYWIRLRAIGSTISAKMWLVGEAEPGAFQISVSDANFPTGKVGIRTRVGNGTPTTAVFSAASAGDTAVRGALGTNMFGSSRLVLASTLNAAPGVRYRDNIVQFDLSSDWKARFVAPKVNLTAVFAATASLRPLVTSTADKLKPGEAVIPGESSLTAKAFVPLHTLPRHFEGDRYHRRFAEDYAVAFNDLLPTGPAWPRESDTVLQKAVEGLSAFWGSAVEKLAELLLVRESDPRSTVILLPDWEKAWGLPDKCLAEPLTVHDRQVALVHKMTLIGAQSRDFFIGVAAAIGYTIEIREWAPFMCGISMCGDTRKFSAIEAVSTNPNFNVDSSITIDPNNQFKYNFEDAISALGWTGDQATVTPTGFGITVVPTGSNPLIRSPSNLGIVGSTHRYIVIEVERLAARSIGAWQGQVYYTTAGHGESELFTKKIPEIVNVVSGERVDLVVDMHTLTAGGNDWLENDITQIRIDFEDGQLGPVTPNGQFRINTITIGSALRIAAPPSTNIVVQADDDNYRWEIGRPEMRFFWAVKVGAVRFTWFRASSGQAGVNHHLEFALATDIECILRRWKPAHTEIIFDYSPMIALDFSKSIDSSFYIMIF